MTRKHKYLKKKREKEEEEKGREKIHVLCAYGEILTKTCNRKILKSTKNVLNILLSKNKASSKTTYSV